MGFAWAGTSAYAFIILLALVLIYHLLCLFEPVRIVFFIYCENYVVMLLWMLRHKVLWISYYGIMEVRNYGILYG